MALCFNFSDILLTPPLSTPNHQQELAAKAGVEVVFQSVVQENRTIAARVLVGGESVGPLGPPGPNGDTSARMAAAAVLGSKTLSDALARGSETGAHDAC